MSRDRFKTSVVVLGERQVDEFQALCALLGRRPHQLAADMVLAEIRRYRRRKHISEAVRLLVQLRHRHDAQTVQPVDLTTYRAIRSGSCETPQPIEEQR